MPLPSAPEGIANKDTVPLVVMRAILAKPPLVNHRLPSAPVAMRRGKVFGPESNSLMTPDVVIRPIFFEPSSVNHSAPSGPTVISIG